MTDLKLHITKEMLVQGAFKHFDGEFKCSSIQNNVDKYEIDKPIVYSVDLTNTGDSILIMGEANTEASTLCSRCLNPTRVELTGKIDACYLIEEPDEYDIDEFNILPKDHAIDLGDLICASLIIDAPLKPLCKDDCLGLCPQCGKNLNEGSCMCEEEVSSPFSALKDFKVEG